MKPLIDLAALPDGEDAWIFPGQGAQQIGMSLDFAAAFSESAALFAEAEEVLGYSLADLIKDGPDETLTMTVHTQPAVFVASLAALKAAEATGLLSRPRCLAGHSLGEYSAVVASGSLSFADGLRLVNERARLMQQAGEASPGSLVALLGADIEQALALAADAGSEVCNVNAPGQVVLGGTLDAVRRTIERARGFGIKRAVELKVGGAFHSSLMRPAANGLARFASGIDFGNPEVPVVANTSGRALTSGSGLAEELIQQISNPVIWRTACGP
ncbi:MAG: acyltransferase domain-containing protein [Dehalococcoidia bacterium]|nr:acyltransferase domain-containing protein [Dehalococcoidia bacterium]